MGKIIIDHSKCVKCGLCSKDCTNFVLAMAGDKVMEINPNCLSCGHCQAICPTGAIQLVSTSDNDGPDLNDIEEYDSQSFSVNPDNLLRAIKFRRSMRHFTPQPLEEEKIRQVIEAGRYSPTACNVQGVSYIVLRQQLPEVQHQAMLTFRKMARFFSVINNVLHLPVDAKKMARAKDSFLFKGAPAVILVVSNNPIDGALASANMEQMATAMGLGVLHVGFFTIISKVNFKVRRLLGLKFGQKVIDCLCLGYPGVQYQRTAPRKLAKIQWL